MTHTPGPWTAKIEPSHYPGCDDTDLPAFVRDADGAVVAHVPESYSVGKSYEANARLIAAAPDLLSILEDIEREIGHWEIDWKDGPTTIGEIVSAAITKAKVE
jgi:hypothetical protein